MLISLDFPKFYTDKIQLDTKISFKYDDSSCEILSPSAIRAMSEYLADSFPHEWPSWNDDRMIREIGKEWITTHGDYVGTFPKRVAKWLYKTQQFKIPPDKLSVLGEIVRRNSLNISGDYTFDIVTHFDWNSGDYGDNGSCFWGSRKLARYIMRDNHCQSLRFYDNCQNGNARCWIIPYNEKFFFCFNGYGYDLILQVRILSLYLGLSYKKVDLEYTGQEEDTIWINGNSGYVLGQYQDIQNVDKIYFEFREYTHHSCENCGTFLEDDDDSYEYNDSWYCEHCYNRYFSTCDLCGETYNQEDLREIEGESICSDCLREHIDDYFRCDQCGEWHKIEDKHCVIRIWHDNSTDNYFYCEDCFTRRMNSGYIVKCDHCGMYFYGNTQYSGSGIWNCPQCDDILTAIQFAESDPIGYIIAQNEDIHQ